LTYAINYFRTESSQSKGETMSRLKNKIKAALAKEGYTLTELAIKMDISTGTLSNYFRRDGMKMQTALNLSDALADMTGYHLTLNDFRKDEA